MPASRLAWQLDLVTPLSFKSDLAHRFSAKDFADVESFHGGGAALLFGAHDLLHDRVHLVAQAIEGGPIWIFNQYQNVEILRAGRLAIQDFVVEDDLLLFLLIVNRLYSSGDLFDVIIT